MSFQKISAYLSAVYASPGPTSLPGLYTPPPTDPPAPAPPGRDEDSGAPPGSPFYLCMALSMNLMPLETQNNFNLSFTWQPNFIFESISHISS